MTTRQEAYAKLFSSALITLEPVWKATKNLAKLGTVERQWAGIVLPEFAKRWRVRTLRGILPDGSKTFALSKEMVKRKAREGVPPIRNLYLSGQTWESLAIKVNAKGLSKVYFSGYRVESGKRKTYAGAGGKERQLSNQQVANRWALYSAPGHRLPDSSRIAPLAFMAPSQADFDWANKMWEQLQGREIPALPVDTILEATK